MCEIKTEGVYGDFSEDKSIFDFSNFSFTSKYYDDLNKYVVGKMKDKTGGIANEEIVELKPKIYSFLIDNVVSIKKAKGVNKSVVARINHSEYNNVLLNNKSLSHSMNRI